MSHLAQPDDAPLLAARALSRVLFGGARYRLEVGAAVGSEKIVNTSELADRLGLSRQSVNHELRVLERAGLLRRAEPGAYRGRTVFFIAEESRYWDFCADAMSNAKERVGQPWSF